MEALNCIHKSSSAADSKNQDRIRGRELTNSSYHGGCWSLWPSWRARGESFSVPHEHCQAGLTSICPLQMKKPSKQQDFSRGTDFHSPATAEGALNCIGQHRPTLVMCVCSFFKINWITSLLALRWACPNLCISRTVVSRIPVSQHVVHALPLRVGRPQFQQSLCVSALLTAQQWGPDLDAAMVKSLMSICLPSATFTWNTAIRQSQMLYIMLQIKSVLFLLASKQQFLGFSEWLNSVNKKPVSCHSEVQYNAIRMKVWAQGPCRSVWVTSTS